MTSSPPRILLLLLSAFAVVLPCLHSGWGVDAKVLSSYDRSRALRAVYYSKTAYCPVDDIYSWNSTSAAYNPGLQEIVVFDHSNFDMQAFTGYDKAHNEIIVAFRGSSNIKNWIADLTFIFTDYAEHPNCNGCRVHKGFYETWTNMSQQVLQDVAAKLSRHRSASIFVTGHSLGAAVAELAEVDMVKSFPNQGHVLYTFGEPRVGDDNFVSWVGTIYTTRHIRITHNRDPVPHVPPMLLGYLHVPTEVWFKGDGDDGEMQCQDSYTSEDPNCSDTIILYDLLDHLRYMGRKIGTQGACFDN